ncbi:MAG: hypothetical protein L6R41_002397 [Letrouitia leprolyta]|nr:MAG: hypothetical protein L6R41_002397 [Letrouitia leprolyta]
MEQCPSDQAKKRSTPPERNGTGCSGDSNGACANSAVLPLVTPPAVRKYCVHPIDVLVIAATPLPATRLGPSACSNPFALISSSPTTTPRPLLSIRHRRSPTTTFCRRPRHELLTNSTSALHRWHSQFTGSIAEELQRVRILAIGSIYQYIALSCAFTVAHTLSVSQQHRQHTHFTISLSTGLASLNRSLG